MRRGVIPARPVVSCAVLLGSPQHDFMKKPSVHRAAFSLKSTFKNDIVSCIADVVQWLERGTFTPTPINAGVAQLVRAGVS